MAHARWRFDEAKTSDQQRAHPAPAWIGWLYQIEREAKDEIAEAIERLTKEGQLGAVERAGQEPRLAEEIRYRLCQEQSRPVVEKFEKWLETAARQVSPQSPIGEAIGYARSNWTARTTAILLSLAQTRLVLKIEPFAYL